MTTEVTVEEHPEPEGDVTVTVPVEVNVEPEPAPEPEPASMNDALELVERMREAAEQAAAAALERHHAEHPHEHAPTDEHIRQIAGRELDDLLEEPEPTVVAPDVGDLEQMGEGLADDVTVVLPDVESEPTPQPSGWMRHLKRAGW